MMSFWQDLRYGTRMMLKRPLYTVVAVLSLALGIGASTAIFSFVDAVLLSPLPYPQPDRIMQLRELDETGSQMAFAEPNYLDVRSRSHSFESLAEYSGDVLTVTGASEAVRVQTTFVSSDFFRVMKVGPQTGRTFLPEESRPGGNAVVVVSHGFWQRWLGGKPDFGNAVLKILDRSCSVVGVMPQGFDFPDRTELWVARELLPPMTSRTAHNWEVVGRLGAGVKLEQARVELSGIGRQLKQEYGPETNAVDLVLIPQQEYQTGKVRSTLLILLGAVGLLLLIACANVANLLLAQLTARQQELSVRQALGASRLRLTQQFMTECVLLTLCGAAFGVMFSFWGVDLLTGLAGESLPHAEEIVVDLRAQSFALALSLLTGVMLGLVPALRRSGTDLPLDNSRRTSGTGEHRVQSLFAVLQVAVTMVLLIGAGLLGRSFYKLLQKDPGFRPESAVAMTLSLSGDMVLDEKQLRQFMGLYERITKGERVRDDELPRYEENPQEKRISLFYRQLIERLSHLPGVTAVGGVNGLPLTGGAGNGVFLIDNIPGQTGYAEYRTASPGYFGAMGIPLLRGRLFDQTDRPGSPHAAVISQSLARKYWPHEDPIGRRIQFGNMDGDLRLLNIVGVVGDVHEQLDADVLPTVYADADQRPHSIEFTIVARAGTDASLLIGAMRRELQSLTPNIPANFRTLEQVFSSALDQRRFTMVLFGAFAGVALLLAVTGIYGVLAYTVSQRTREIGIRMAMGAQPSQVLRLVLGQGAKLAALGVAIGAGCAVALRRLIATFLFDVSATDPLTFMVIALLLMVVTLLACLVPARRAAHVDPMVALRLE